MQPIRSRPGAHPVAGRGAGLDPNAPEWWPPAPPGAAAATPARLANGAAAHADDDALEGLPDVGPAPLPGPLAPPATDLHLPEEGQGASALRFDAEVPRVGQSSSRDAATLAARIFADDGAAAAAAALATTLPGHHCLDATELVVLLVGLIVCWARREPNGSLTLDDAALAETLRGLMARGRADLLETLLALDLVAYQSTWWAGFKEAPQAATWARAVAHHLRRAPAFAPAAQPLP